MSEREPQSTVDFYIIAGQSNTGRSLVSEMSSTEYSKYGNMRSRTFILNPACNATRFYPLNAGINTILDKKGEFGFESSFAAINEKITDDETFIVKYGVGSSDLATRWNGDLYKNLQSYVSTALLRIKSLKKVPVLKGFFWMQGENDATMQSWADNYLKNLNTFFSNFTSWWSEKTLELNLPESNNYKKVIGRVNGANDVSEVYRDKVRKAQSEFCMDPANNSVLINTDYYPCKDHVHFSAEGQIKFGLDIVESIYLPA